MYENNFSRRKLNLKNKFITILLALIAIVLIIALGILGTIIYGEISGQQIIDLGFIEDFGYPTTEYNASIENTNTISSSEGVIGNVEGYEPKQSSGKNLYEQLDTNAKIIYDKLYDSKESLKTGRYQVDFGDTFHDTLSQENGSKELQKQYQSAIEALIYENPDIFYLDPNNMFINIEETSRIWGSTYNVFINNGTSIDYLDEGFESKEDVIRIVRLYLSRWRIEEHFRGKKQEYDFENMRVRTLKSMNNLNMMLTIHLGHIAILADKIDSKFSFSRTKSAIVIILFSETSYTREKIECIGCAPPV